MHIAKVAQVLSRSMHFAVELAEFYISYNGKILKLVQTRDWLSLHSPIDHGLKAVTNKFNVSVG